jgi:putative oxidoreductase
MVRRTVVILLRLMFVALFAYSGWVKLKDPYAFSQMLDNYQLFSKGMLPFLTSYIPLLELTLSLSLLLPVTYKAALYGNVFLLMVFQGALLSLLIRGIDADCGCLGSLGSSPIFAVMRNFILLGITMFLIFSYKEHFKGKIDDSPLYQ